MSREDPSAARFEGGDPGKLSEDAYLRATVVFGWMAFKDPLRTMQILAELIEEIRGKAHLPQETWLDGNPSLKGKIALLEQTRDWIVEKIRAEKLHAYIRTLDLEMRPVPSHDFIGRLTIHPLRGELTSLYSDDDKEHQESSLVVQARKRSGLTGEVWFSRNELMRLRADTPHEWAPVSEARADVRRQQLDSNAQFRGPAPPIVTGVKSPHKRKSNGLDHRSADEPLLIEMDDLIRNAKARSPEDAARAVVTRAVGGGKEASKVKRLAKHYREKYTGLPFE